MKLLYACADRADDPHHWSGIVSNCRAALESAGAETCVFDRIPFDCPLPLRLFHRLYKRLGKKTHYLQIEPSVLRFSRGDCDAVFCPGTGVPVHAYLPASMPVFSYLDASKRSWIGAYHGMNTLCDRSRDHVGQVDRAGLTNHTLTVFSSEWAKSEAACDYEIPEDKMAVVPFGANLRQAPERAQVDCWIACRSAGTLRLLFLGKEWERKGGPEALEIVRKLRAMGLEATLDVVGCAPDLAPVDRSLARIHGFLDHSAPEGQRIFHALLRDAHLLIFLSRAEAYGIALCEAAAFGVPAFAANVGGIPTIVNHGVNGWLSERPFSASASAALIAGLWRSPRDYARVALAARADYESRLNWTAAGRTLRGHIEEALARRKG
jgi:glycosyltransferase involved in cell wall biosynthesis